MKRDTDLLEKLIPSIINLVLIFTLTYIFSLIFSFSKLLYIQITFVLVALIYDFSIAIFNNNRCIGMIIMNTNWNKDYPIKQRILYALILTVSCTQHVSAYFHRYTIRSLAIIPQRLGSHFLGYTMT